MNKTAIQNHLIINTLLDEPERQPLQLIQLVKQSKCNIYESYLNKVGNKMAVTISLHGSWDQIAKIEKLLQQFEQQQALYILTTRIDAPSKTSKMMPYMFDMISVDDLKIIPALTTFISDQELDLQSLSSYNYEAPKTHTLMLYINLTLHIPQDRNIGIIRTDFTDFCDRFNIDFVMEPLR